MKVADKKDSSKKAGLLTARQLADVLQVSESTVHRLRRTGKIPAIIVTNRIIRFSWRDVRAALGGRPDPPETEDDTQLAFTDLYSDFL